jgi:uncharacterized membrane protein YeaQ/YmgE (transglycosylase-associated protein family)
MEYIIQAIIGAIVLAFIFKVGDKIIEQYKDKE